MDGSIGTQPDIALDVPVEWGGRKLDNYLVKLREGQALLIKLTQDYLKKNQRKVTKFVVSTYVLQYHNKPDKRFGLYHGPMEIISIDRPDIITVRDLTTEKVSSVHTTRLRLFRLDLHDQERDRSAV